MSRIVSLGAALLAIVALENGGSICAEGPVQGPVKVSVLSIMGSESHDVIDAKVECIAKQVRKVEPKLIGFRFERITCKSLAVGAKEEFELADGQRATISIDRWTGKDMEDRVQLKITPPLLGEITYTSACGKFLPILTRHRTANNELLILAVRVQHCTGKDK